MLEQLVIDTEAILAELRRQDRTSRGINPEARDYIRSYYPQFAELRAVGRFVDIVNQRFGLKLSKAAIQNVYQKQKGTENAHS